METPSERRAIMQVLINYLQGGRACAVIVYEMTRTPAGLACHPFSPGHIKADRDRARLMSFFPPEELVNNRFDPLDDNVTARSRRK